MDIAVREADRSDRRAIMELIGHLAQDWGVSAGLTDAYVGVYLDSPGCRILLAEDGETQGAAPLGLLCLSLRPNLFHGAPSGLIEELVVTPAARGRGIGKALMRAALDVCQAGGCAEVGVATGFENERAQRLYRDFGLVEESLLLERHFEGQ